MHLKDIIDYLSSGDCDNVFNSCLNLLGGTNKKTETLLDIHKHFHRKIKQDKFEINKDKTNRLGQTNVNTFRKGKSVLVDIKDKDRFINEVIESFVKSDKEKRTKESQPIQLKIFEQKINDLKTAIEDKSLIARFDGNMDVKLYNHEISLEQAFEHMDSMEFKMENFLKTVNTIQEKSQTIDKDSEFEKTMIAAEKFEALLTYMHDADHNPYLFNQIQETIGEMDVDTSQKFVQAGLLMFGANARGVQYEEFVGVVEKTCRNCAKDFRQVEFMSQEETYERMRKPIPKLVQVNPNGIGKIKPEKKDEKKDEKKVRNKGVSI